MRVAFVEQASQLGGVEYSTLRVAQGMDKSRFQPVIICPEDGDLPRLARQAGLEVQIVSRPEFYSVSYQWGRRYIPNLFGFLSTAVSVFRAARSLSEHLSNNPVDLMITKGLLAHFYGGMTARRLHIPCIWYMQEEVDKNRAGGLYHLLLKQGARVFPARIIVDAEALLAQFGELPASKQSIQVIYNGIDTDQFKPFSSLEREAAKRAFNISEQAVVIGQAGRIIPLKGQDVLLQAFIKLMQNYQDIYLLFVGAALFDNQNYENRLRVLIKQYGLQEKVHFTGFLPDVCQGLAAMDIFVHASVETDSPISVMEAMACSLPVVVSMVQGTAELVNPAVDAMSFEPGNADALAIELEKLIVSEQLRFDLGKKARDTVIEKFSLLASVSQLQDAIEEVYAA